MKLTTEPPTTEPPTTEPSTAEPPAPLPSLTQPVEIEAAALRDSAEALATLGWRQRLRAQIPGGQILRYLCVGVFNTLFGYTVFAVLNFLLHRSGVPVSYLFASALSNLISITVAYLAYKFFVFRTRGNYLSEWLKAMAVYWSGFVPSLFLLPALVRVLNWILPAHVALLHHSVVRRDLAPYIATAILMAFGVVYSFFGHKNVTFRQRASV